MKSFLALTALAAVTLSLGSAVAETLGLLSRAFVSAEVGLAVFVAAFSLLAFFSAYSAPRVTRVRRRHLARALAPAREAFAGGCTCHPVRSAAGREAAVTAVA